MLGSFMGDQKINKLNLVEARNIIAKLEVNLNSLILGQQTLISEIICSFLSGGHALITGAPGLAKTTLVKTFASHLGLQFGRIQFTPDLLPTDITGSDILNIDTTTGKRHFEFVKGPIFCNILLADEINRSAPKTQSALLESMQEKTVTYGGVVQELPDPFMVLATQNPFESEGTFPLPEAQLDRFLIHSFIEYPEHSFEKQVLKYHSENRLINESMIKDKKINDFDSSLVNQEVLKSIVSQVREVSIDDKLIDIITELMKATRPDDDFCPHEYKDLIWYGAGPRAGLSLISIAKSHAWMKGDEAVKWDHIIRFAKPVLRHRIRLSSQAIRDQFTADKLIEDLLKRIVSKYDFLSKGIY